MMFVSERVEKKPKVQTYREVCSALRQIMKKPLTKKWVCLMFFKRFGLDGPMTTLTTVLVSEDLPKEYSVEASLAAGFPILFCTFFLFICLKKGSMYRTIYHC